MRADLPKDELERQAVLDAYRVLDTLPEPEFDRIVALASRLVGVPIALVSLVDEDRQWFKAEVGLGGRETPREHAFCAHTILDDRVMVVEDALLDERFASNPLVQGDPRIRFYAGAPLNARDHRIGTLCVIDREPRELSEEHRQILRDLAAVVVAQLEGRLALLEVGERNAQLEQMHDSLAAKNQELERFTSSASHDLRSPLRTISSFLELLEDEYGPVLDDEGREYIGYARDGALRAQHLMEQLLEYARSGAVDEESVEFDLDQVLDHVLGDLRVAIEESGGAVHREPLPTLVGAPRAAYQVLTNLVGNALKYARPGVAPDVRVSAERIGSEWQVRVTDNGIGIAEEAHDAVFQPFERISTDVAGSGLGLAVATRAARKLGGALRIEASGPTGTQFVLSLPAADS